MKTPEDEAFDDLARKQGMWGGGFQAKRQAAMDKINSHFDEAYKKMHEDRAKYGTSWSKDGERIDPMSVYLDEPAQEPIAYVTGTHNGRFVVAPLNPAMVLPVGMALYTAPSAPQPAQEPVAWMYDWLCDGKLITGWIAHNEAEIPKLVASNIRPLYTTPPKREWVGLTEEDFLLINQLCINPIDAAEFVNRLLKEKNT